MINKIEANELHDFLSNKISNTLKKLDYVHFVLSDNLDKHYVEYVLSVLNGTKIEYSHIYWMVTPNIEFRITLMHDYKHYEVPRNFYFNLKGNIFHYKLSFEEDNHLYYRLKNILRVEKNTLDKLVVLGKLSDLDNIETLEKLVKNGKTYVLDTEEYVESLDDDRCYAKD